MEAKKHGSMGGGYHIYIYIYMYVEPLLEEKGALECEKTNNVAQSTHDPRKLNGKIS